MGDRTFEFMSRDKLSLHWSAIHYVMTFVCHSGRGTETPVPSKVELDLTNMPEGFI